MQPQVLRNPMRQDVSADGTPRFYPIPIPFSYGMLPQTYESPEHRDEGTALLGDGDPLDAIDLTPPSSGGAVPPLLSGTIVTRRIVGALGMIDGGALDWKIFVVTPEHPLSGKAERQQYMYSFNDLH